MGISQAEEKTMLRVLIGCETSGIARRALDGCAA